MGRLKNKITADELKAAKEIYIRAKENNGMVNMRRVTEKIGVAASICNSALKLLYVAGIIDYRSKGPQGTLVTIEDEEKYKELIK